MKKTIIALIALAGMSMAETVLPTYDLKVITSADSTADSTTTNADFWFGEDSLTLNSYMLDFTINAKPSGSNKYYFQITSTDDSSKYIKYGAWKPSAPYGSGIYVKGDTGDSHVHAVENDNTLQFSIGDTLRFAYDGEANIAYIYNVDTEAMTIFNIGASTNKDGASVDWGDGYSFVSGQLSSTSTTGATKVIASGNQYATYGNITDMSSLAGNEEAFKTYVKSLRVIPEPTTATLSLLALAGLAARRRRR